MIVRRRCKVLEGIQCGASGLTTSTRIALQILLNIPVLGRGVNYCIVSPRIKDLRSQLCFLSLSPSITVVSEKDNLFNNNNNNKNFKYDSTYVHNCPAFPNTIKDCLPYRLSEFPASVKVFMITLGQSNKIPFYQVLILKTRATAIYH